MLEKISQAAEKMATSASRRQFLGRLGRGAMAAAAALAGLLALPGDAQAARRRVCNNVTSDVSCWGATVGDPCVDGQGFRGRCRAVRGSAGRTATCICK
jgi:hypothetical protein